MSLTDRIQELEAEVAKLQQENDALCQSELEMARERNKFADLYDFAPLGYVILSPDATVVEANLFAAQLVGMKRTTFIGEQFSAFIPKGHHDKFSKFLTTDADSTTTETCELKLQSESGQRLDISLQKRHVTEPDDTEHIYLTINDITSRKKIEAELQSTDEAFRISEDRFRLALKNSPISVFNQDRDLQYTWVYNNVVLESPDAFLGKTDYDLWASAEAEILSRLKEEVMESGQERRSEIKLMVDGKAHYFDVLIAPHLDASGEVIGLNGVSFDLTESKETALEMSRQRVLAESLANAVSAVHVSVNLSEVLDFIMSSMANVIPHDLADIMLIEDNHVQIARSRGYSHLQLAQTVLPIDQPASQIPLVNLMLGSQKTLLIPDLQEVDEDDPIVTVDWLHGYVGAPLLWQQRVIGFINLMSTKRDFFSEEHAERLTIFAAQAALAIINVRLHGEARQAAVLQERQRLARDLHDAVSQSLYTSNMIADSLQLLYKTQPDKVPENLEKLRILNRGALAEMRTLLLALRPEKLEATSMQELMQQLADAAHARTGLSTELFVEEDADIPADLKEALYRITQEALTNIIKHAKASHVHVRYTHKDGAVKLVIEDDGKGFDTSDPATHRMGISNMKERMAAFGGSVDIDSEIDGGTVVTAQFSG